MPILPISLLEPGEIVILQEDVDFSLQIKMIMLIFLALCLIIGSYINDQPKKDKIHEI